MSTVFVGGSRRIVRLEAEVRDRIQKIVKQGLSVVVGDANGADKAVQRVLVDENYRDVRVYCSGKTCRNNVGNWRTRQVDAGGPVSGFWFYAAKDIAMSEDADYGLMIWDGASVGTVHNMLNLVDKGKPVVVYFAPEARFINLKTASDLRKLLARCPGDVLNDFERKLGVTGRLTARHAKLDMV